MQQSTSAIGHTYCTCMVRPLHAFPTNTTWLLCICLQGCAAGVAKAYLQKAVALAPESESGHQRAATAVATAMRARSGASHSNHSNTDWPAVVAPVQRRCNEQARQRVHSAVETSHTSSMLCSTNLAGQHCMKTILVQHWFDPAKVQALCTHGPCW